MTLGESANGPFWVIWVVLAIFLILTIVFLSGHGVNLIAGYNTASKKEQEKYNSKKLCRVMGCGMAVITVMIFVMAIGENVLPASFANVFGAVVLADCIVMVVLCNTICRKKDKVTG